MCSSDLERTAEMAIGIRAEDLTKVYTSPPPAAAASGPFGTTVAHGYLTLAMLPMLLSEVVSVTDAVMGVNYGTEKIRFTSPVPSGSRVRLHAKLVRAERRGPSVVWTVGVEVEIEGKEKPALVGEVVYMAAGAPDA